MAQVSARQLALIALEQWQGHIGRADSIISELLAEVRIAGPDRGFALELFYGVLRNLTLLDFWIHCLRPAKTDPEVQDILRLGLYQLLILQTPEYAAVNESVELARPKTRPVVNGVLRTAVRQCEELRHRSQMQPLSIRESHPDFLVARWQKRFGPEATTALCRWNNQPPPIYARVNELLIDSEQFAHRYPTAERCETWPGFFRLSVLLEDALRRGHCYIQDPSTVMACQLLDPQPGERILDACAAPGGKTTYLAQRMRNQGLILACDRDGRRLQILRDNISRLQAKIIQTVQHDWRQPATPPKMKALDGFDRILVDAPCSNTGVIRRRLDVRWRLQRDDFHRMQANQMEIVRAVVQLLRPGGSLVYSTCSIEQEENEMVVERLTGELPAARLVDQTSLLPFRNGCDGAFAAKVVTAANGSI